MTNDQHDEHDHNMDVSPDDAQGGATWHDQPVDGFSDEPGGATVSEEPEHSGEAAGETAPGGRKRNPLVAIIIAFVAVGILGGVGYVQFGSLLTGGKSAAIADSMPLPKMPAMAKPQNMPPVTPPAVPDSPTVAPRTDIAGTPNNPLPPPSPSSPMGQVGTALPAGTTFPPQIAAANPPPNLPPPDQQGMPAHPFPTPANIPVGMPPQPPAAPPALPMNPAAVPPASDATETQPGVVPGPLQPPAPSAVNHVLDARMTALTARVDDMQKSLQDANQKLAEISDKLNAAPAASTAANPVLDDRLTKLEQKLAQIEDHVSGPSATDGKPAMKPLTAPGFAGTNNPPSEDAAITEPAVKPAASGSATSHPRHVAHRVTHHHRVVAQRHHAAPKMAATTSWVLRAASDNQAWIAKSATADLRPVHVGDEVPGLGKVLAISETDQGWIVKGTHGVIQ